MLATRRVTPKSVIRPTQLVTKGRNPMIIRADRSHAGAVARLAGMMWSHSAPELEAEFEDLLVNPEAAIFLCCEDGKYIGFAQCQLRRDYVEGTETSPVGYLEGFYVMDEYRHRGYGRMLVRACENWAREKGCREFASDCELDNHISLKFHLHSGFREANRIICFVKEL